MLILKLKLIANFQRFKTKNMFISSLRLIITKREPTTQEAINKILLPLSRDIGRYALYGAVVRGNQSDMR